ncbi:MAG: hypothetical protein QM775_10155 [Pirellulales bacterium]
MERHELEVYSSTSNYAIIKPPGRSFPGCVIQGDSLSALCNLARNIRVAIAGLQLENRELLENAEDLSNALIDRLLHYQNVLKAHDISLPYSRVFTDVDLVKESFDEEEQST